MESSPKVRDRPSREGIIRLMRGDIITLHAPTTSRGYHLKTFYIDYIDDELIRLLSDQSQSPATDESDELAVVILHLDEHGHFKDADNAITMVELIARAPEHGYARQRGFKQGTWIEIHFNNGNANGIIIGKIISLAEGGDCICVSIFNSPHEINRIYIDFEFKGLSHEYITQIRICDEPESAKSSQMEQAIMAEVGEGEGEGEDEEDEADETADETDDGDDSDAKRMSRGDEDDDEAGQSSTEMLSPPPVMVNADAQTHAIQAGDVLFVGFINDREELEFDVDVPEYMVRYDLDVQQNDLMESLFSDLRTDRRTLGAQKAIQKEVDRFTELRNACSVTDDHGRTQRRAYYMDDYKPLSEYLAAFPNHTDKLGDDIDIPFGDWLIPIYVQNRKLYAEDAGEKADLDDCLEGRNHTHDATVFIMDNQMTQETDEYVKYSKRQNKSFSDYMLDIKSHLTPFVRPSQSVATSVFVNSTGYTKSSGAFDSIVTGIVNFESLTSPVYSKNASTVTGIVNFESLTGQVSKKYKKFSCSEYGNMARYIAHDEIPQRATAYMTRPLPFVTLSALKRMSASVLDKSHAGYLESSDPAYLSLCLWNLGADDRALFKTRRINGSGKSGVGVGVGVGVADNASLRNKLFVSSREIFISANGDGNSRFFTDDDALYNMVPSTGALFDIVKKELSSQSLALSPRVLATALTPFLIQQRHITQSFFTEFAAFIMERIDQYKDQLRQMRVINDTFTNRDYGVEPAGINPIYEMIMRRHQTNTLKGGSVFAATVVASYGLKEWSVNVNAQTSAASKRGSRSRILSNSELISKMMAIDFGRCFMNEIVQMNHSHTYSLFGQNVDRVISKFADDAEEYVADKERSDKNSSDKDKCKNLVLAKEYYSLDDLLNDNEMKEQQGIDILYDIKRDSTNYEFVEPYRTKERTMPREVFKTFLISELMRKRKLHEHDADIEAESIINGVRRVQKNDYAVVIARKLAVDPAAAAAGAAGEAGAAVATIDEASDAANVDYWYYKMNNAGLWVRDHTMPETVRSDDASYFCNVQPKCIQMKAQCLSLDRAAGQVDSKLLNSMAKADLISKTQKEFESQFDIGSTNFAEYMDHKESYDAYRMTKNRFLARLAQTAQNDREFMQGLNEAAAAAASVSADARSGSAILISAATGILANIMADESFSRKQALIVNFVNKYTSNIESDKHWLVCKETNIRLLPRWVHVRAAAFIRPNPGSGSGSMGGVGGGVVVVGGNTGAVSVSYSDVLDQLCREYGIQEGDAWVDRITGSGMVIKRVNFSHDEGYDEDGFKQVSHSVIEPAAIDRVRRDAIEDSPGIADAVTMSISQHLKSPNARKINDVVQRVLSEGLGISPDRHNLRMRIIGKVIDTMANTPKMFSTEAKMEIIAKYKLQTKTANLTEKEYHKLYEEYADKLIVTLTLAHIVIALQCIVPSIRPSNMIPKCEEYYNAQNPFSGFPLNGKEDTHCIRYIACVATRIKSESTSIWANFKGSKLKNIEPDIINLIEQVILKNSNIRDELAARRQEIVDRQNRQASAPLSSLSAASAAAAAFILPKSLSTTKWKHFFPLLHSLDGIKPVGELPPEVKSMYLKELKTCRASQFETQEILRSKIMQYSLYIQKCVQDIVRKKGGSSLLLFSGEAPSTENACCDETRAGSGTTLEYFMGESNLIREYNEVVSCLDNIFVDIAHISRAVMFCNTANTRTSTGVLSSEFSEDTIYRGFVAFCKLDRNIPVINPAILKLAGKKPDDYSERDEWSDKFRKLKSDHSHSYTPETFEKLLNIVNAGSIVGISSGNGSNGSDMINERQISRIEPLRRILSSVAIQEVQVQEHVEVISADLQGDLLELMDTYDMRRMESEANSKAEVKCYDHLYDENNKMIRSIRAAIIPQHHQPSSSIEAVFEFINSADRFDEEPKSEHVILRYATNEDAATVKYVQFIKRSIRFMMVTIPGLLTQSSFDSATGVIVPRHWNFSKKHGSDIAAIIGKQCASLEEFFNKDHVRRCVSQIMPLDGDAADTSLCGIIMQLVDTIPFTANNRSVLSARVTRQFYKYLFIRVIKIYAYFIDHPTGKINVSVDLSLRATSSSGASTSTSSSTKKSGSAASSASSAISANLAVAAAADAEMVDAAEAKRVSDAISDLLDPTQLTSVHQAHRDAIVPPSIEIFQMLQDSKTQMRRLLVELLRIVMTFKAESNKTVDAVMQSTAISKRKETEQIRHKLRSMDVEKRNVVDILKKCRIGEWNVNQKQLTRYDKKTYDTGLGVIMGDAADAAGNDRADDADADATETALAAGIISNDAPDILASSRSFDPEQYENVMATAAQSSPEIDGQNAFAALDGDDYVNDQMMRNEFGIGTTCY